MKAVMTKGTAAVVTPVNAPPPPCDTFTILPKEQTVNPPDLGIVNPNALEPTIYRFILRRSLPHRLLLLGLTMASFPLLYLPLDLPKIIINRALAGTNFPQQLFSLNLHQINYLFLLSALFLCLGNGSLMSLLIAAE
jgi:hypothetical protein